ncbi:MAG: glycosyltransferase [Saprospiraceae bacterium]|nr:glycosyltransferase [Saprospiraceae bacterium]
MKLSIVTPTFNSAATIRDTLESVQMQDHLDVEHIIIDGVSNDPTLEILADYPHVSKVISEPDRGLYDAMNKGVLLATGDVVGILNSDDYYTHAQVLSRVAALLEQTGADALYADLEYVAANDTSRVVRCWKSGHFHPNSFHKGWMPPHPTFFVRRYLYEQYGLFKPELRFSADYELMLRFILKHHISVCYLPEVTVKMRTGGASNANLRNRFLANREDRLAWKMNGLRPKFYTLYLKPLLKIPQYL